MFQDFRFALRLLVKSPGFAAAAIVALGFGIGLSTSVFNAFAGMLLRPIPHVKDENRLVFLNSQQLGNPNSFYELTMPDIIDLRAQSKTLEGITTTIDRTIIFTGTSSPHRVLGASISVEGFAMLGVTPHRGRIFDLADGAPNAPPVAIISYALWQTRFGGRDDTIGSSVELNGRMHTLIGVMPKGFRFPDNHDLWTPIVYDTKEYERGSHDFPGWARLRPGVSLDEAKSEIAGIAAQLAIAYPRTNEGQSFAVRSVREEATQGVRTLMNLMLGASLFVLLIACANVANLLLARAAGRAHEMSIRVAVGATRIRILRQVLTESLVLGVLGGAFGLLVATWSDSILFAGVPHEQLQFWMTFGFDWRVFTFAFGAAIFSAFLFGLIPALQISRSAAIELREGGRSITGSRHARILRQTLVVAQIALSAVLLIGAGLFVRSFLKLQGTDPGFDPRGVITFRVGLPPTQYSAEQAAAFFDKLTPALAAIPGVKASGATHMLPSKGNNQNGFVIEGMPAPQSPIDAPRAVFHDVSYGYFTAMRIPLVRGRLFNENDLRNKPRVAIIDRRFAERWMPGVDPIGKRISLGSFSDEERKWAEIVGIVGDVPQKLDEPYDIGGFYFSMDQSDHNFFVNYALHVTGDPAGYSKAIQAAVLSVQADIPIYDVRTMQNLMDAAYWDRRFFGQAFSAFGLGALFLASLGVYGVMAYSVTQRTSEIGVRMALGASQQDVMRLVGRQGLVLVAAGMTIGVISALGLTRLMAGLLYGISPSDPPTYFLLTSVLAATGLVACWLPARRATRINPLTAIRTE